MNNTFLGVLIGLVGVLIGVFITNKWNKREETYRMLRWSCELSTKENKDEKYLGLDSLKGLTQSNILQKDDMEYIDYILDGIMDRIEGDKK